ncbi:AAA family ATPase [Lysobacter maris]|uniref:AAA family ATPase n=1 Tax=Marilutibacter maris TaxID=1605891 RepID=A0A508B3V2_9GAMM|nr:AAA family ATPase [Lysobacter maris]KAB8198438.1 AAA family ATPase [Lysobacter maris]
MSRRLSALRVGNFKAFAGTQRIPLKPITLVFGPNSAGKSSFIHSLALAHEAQFGREKRGRSRLDVHHTDIGGSAVDLGGFRQFVHRGQLRNGVEWGAELRLSELGNDASHKQLAQILSTVDTITVNVSLGIELDIMDAPMPNAEPRVEAVEILADDEELLRMSRRRGIEGLGDFLRLDRLEIQHPVFLQVLKAIIEVHTTSTEMKAEDLDGALQAIDELLPELQIKVDRFLPSGVELPKAESSDSPTQPMLFAISKGNRQDDIAQAVRFVLPRTLNDLIKGLSDVLSDELKQLQYLGPLRSFPARHLAFSETEDSNWYAGGGYAWDVVRRNSDVRKAVNNWLGSGKLRTPYELRIKELVNFERVRDIQLEASDSWEYDGSDDENKLPEEAIKDSFQIYSDLLVDNAILDGRIDAVNELVLMDMRTKTSVTHRDVGIGISQVLPVLVMAYASEGKLLAMEQPEIHLHPALQAELGDVFIKSALGERKNTFILETHSEHLILRLMRRMRETYQGKETGLPPITPDDISVLYVEPDGARSIAREMPLNELGELVKSWPGGFFEEGLREQIGDA